MTRDDHAGLFDLPYTRVKLQLESALIAADWLTTSDDALVALARRIADDLDATGPDQSTAAARLYRAYAEVLALLGLTPAGRRQLAEEQVDQFDPWKELMG